jgi:hypothetical protein
MAGRHAASVTLTAALWLIQGCSSDPDRYPGTDILDIPGFEIQRASEVEQSGNTLQSGTIEYRGEGNLREIFRNYLHSMESLGWMSTQATYDGQTATATLRKDKRSAKLHFVNGKKWITARIHVGATPTSEWDGLQEAK